MNEFVILKKCREIINSSLIATLHLSISEVKRLRYVLTINKSLEDSHENDMIMMKMTVMIVVIKLYITTSLEKSQVTGKN